MKKNIYLFTILIFMLSIAVNSIWAQAPESFLYQAEARDSKGNILEEERLSVKVTILQGMTDNMEDATIEAYTQTTEVYTDINGLFNIKIGDETSFNSIDWNSGKYFLNVKIAIGVSENYTDMGTSQLLAVPYALHAKTAENVINDKFPLPVYTSAQIEELDPNIGDALFNSTEDLFLIFNGNIWLPFNASLNCWPQPTEANAGDKQYIEGGVTTTTLAANDPEPGHGTGEWTIISGIGGSIEDVSSPTSNFTGVLGQTYTLQWQIVTECSRSSDLVTIKFYINNGPGQDLIYNGNSYKTVWINSRLWMAENLKSTKYNDGTDIPILDDVYNIDTNSPFYCWYNNDEATYGNIYGVLYNGHAVNTGKLCPEGWHVPSSSEWLDLYAYINYNGGNIKETGYEHWDYPNTRATNYYGFTALPGGGFYYSDKTFASVKILGMYWSSTVATDYAYGLQKLRLFYNSSVFRWDGSSGSSFLNALSVRCIKD